MADIRLSIPVSNYALSPIVPKTTYETRAGGQYTLRLPGERMELVLQRNNAGKEVLGSAEWGVMAAEFAAIEIPGNFALVDFKVVCGYQRRGRGEYETRSALRPGQTSVRVPNVFDQFNNAGSLRVGDVIEIAGEIKMVTRGVEGVPTDPNHIQVLEFAPGMRKAAPIGTQIQADAPVGRFAVRRQPPTAAVQERSSEFLPIGQLQITLFEEDRPTTARAVIDQNELPPEPEADTEGEEPDDGIEPEADAGSGETFNQPINGILDGTASRQLDSDGNVIENPELTYEWTNVRKPAGESDEVAINSPGMARTFFSTVNLMDGDYDFQLKVTNSEGLSHTDIVTHHLEDNLQALIAPELFRVTRTTRTTLWIGWSPVDDFDGWEIRIKETANSWPASGGWTRRNKRQRYWEFTGLKSGTSYDIQIRAYDYRQGADEFGPAASVTSSTNADTSPTPPPRSLRVSGLTGNSAVMTWFAPLGAVQPTGYSWTLRQSVPGTTIKTVNNTRHRRVNLTTLRPNTRYNFFLTALYGTRRSATLDFNLVTPQAALLRAPTAPTNVELVTRRASQVGYFSIRWAPASATTVKYVWGVYELAADGRTTGRLIESGTERPPVTGAHVRNAVTGRRYRFAVRAVDARGATSGSVSLVFTAPAPVARPAPPAPVSLGPLTLTLTTSGRYYGGALRGSVAAVAGGGIPPYSITFSGASGATVTQTTDVFALVYRAGVRSTGVSATVTDSSTPALTRTASATVRA